MIRADGLSKRFGRRVAVSKLDLVVSSGESVALVGPNGAGKTTVLKLALGLMRPDAGQIDVLGAPASRRGAMWSVGGMIEPASFYPWLSARANLSVLSRTARPVPGRRILLLLERLGLTIAADAPVGGYSHGMLQRLAIAAALLRDPMVLVLDEPTNGLDREGRLVLECLVLDKIRAGGSVLLASHAPEEVERMCTRVIVMREGRTEREGTPFSLMRSAARARIEVEPGQTELACQCLADLSPTLVGAGVLTLGAGSSQVALLALASTGVRVLAFSTAAGDFTEPEDSIGRSQ